MRKADRNQKGVVVKKEEIIAGEGHGGAWKVAYADFVTAMMAFFLLMWLLNATTEDQRKGLADYFSPNSQLSHASSGTGDPFGGHTAFDQGALVSDRGAVQAIAGTRPTSLEPSDADDQPEERVRAARDEDGGAGASQQAAAHAATIPAPVSEATAMASAAAQPSAPPAELPAESALPRMVGAPAGKEAAPDPAAPGAAAAPAAGPHPPNEAELQEARARAERAAFDQAAQQIRAAVGSDPALADLARQLKIDMTPEGLRIQILDEEHRPMFAFGSSDPNDRAKLLLQKVTPVLNRLPQAVSIAGYTDAAPFPGPDRTNWELSTERANATRRLLIAGGLPDGRIRTVTGHADKDPLLPADPLAAENRRIAIVVLRAAPLPRQPQPDATAR